MRTLQRLRHTRPPGPSQLSVIRRSEDRRLQGRKRQIWWRRARRFGLLALVVLAAAVVRGTLARGVVIDGLVVHPNMVVPLAPAQVRVAELFVQPGDRCEPGDVLMRLEALDLTPRGALEEEIEERRARLALVQAGGALDGVDVGRRLDLAEQAELERDTARAELRVALARLHALQEEHDTLVATLEQAQVERLGKSSTLREDLRRAAAGKESALAEERRAELEAEQQLALEQEGIASRRESVFAVVDRSKARSGVEEAAALVESLQRELEVADELATLEIQRAKEALDAMQARIDVASREVDAGRVRIEQWTELEAERRTLLPDDDVDGTQLRELELKVLEAQVRHAEARLASLDRELGNTDVLAGSSGVVDEVFVAAGSIVETGAALARYYDPAQVRLVAYAQAGQVEGLDPGASCRIYPAESRAPIEARIHSVGLSWIELPGMLRGSSTTPSSTPHLPIRIACEGEVGLEALRPNMRLRVVVRREAWSWD